MEHPASAVGSAHATPANQLTCEARHLIQKQQTHAPAMRIMKMKKPIPKPVSFIEACDNLEVEFKKAPEQHEQEQLTVDVYKILCWSI